MKLTNALRNKLAAALTTQAQNAIYDKRRALGKVIAEAALVAKYGEDWEKKFNKIPEGWLPKMSNLYVVSDSLHVCVSLGRLVPMPNMLAHAPLLLNDNKLLQEYLELESYKSDNFSPSMYRSGGRALYASRFQKSMEDALSAINTEEELKETWPEAFELLQGFKAKMPEPPTTPLAIPIASIIEMYRNSLAAAAKPQEEKEEDNVPAN